MKTTLAALFTYWPGKFGLTFQQLVSDDYCDWVLGCCGRWGAEQKLHLDRCAESGIAIKGHVLTRAGDWYEWIKV